ncbi:MAG: MMPL family transporter [Actinomycetota bacterium]|nr:MMPL family transporter [Actinomycetota bacterium]
MIGGWVALVVALVSTAGQAGDRYQDSFLFDGTESHEAAELTTARFPGFPGDRAQLVIHGDTTLIDEVQQLVLLPLFQEITDIAHVGHVANPWSGEPGTAFSTDGDALIADILFTAEAGDLPVADVEELVAAAARWSDGNRQVEIGGATIDTVLQADSGDRERYGLIAALVILVVAFGTLVAAGLPVAVAVTGLGAGLSVVALVSRLMPISSFAPSMASLVGLGAGIDYALFIVTRYRNAIEHGFDTDEAVDHAMASAGRAVVFAGSTVVVSLLALVIVGVELVTGLAVGAALGVLFTMFAAVTLLPAVLAVIGAGVNRLPLGGKRPPGNRWVRWADTVRRRPGPWALCGLGVLILLTVPAFSMRLGTVDAGANPDTTTTRRAHDIVTEQFGPGMNGPLYIVTDLLPTADSDDALALAGLLAATDNVASVSPPVIDEAGVTTIITVVPDSRPDAAETTELVEHLRSTVLPEHAEATGATSMVGGVTAAFVDQSTVLGGRLPALMIAVSIVSFILLVVMFRGLLVALKAVVLNLLSVTAAYGVVVAMFQWGWGLGLVGLDHPGPIIAFAPILLFAILFGLSMDYEVFLLSRIREEYDRHGDNGRAVSEGLASTGKVITSAAAIMIVIFASFTLGNDPVMKLFGVGLAAAIFIDAAIVRTILVPATMELLGDHNWWLPAWTKRWLPDRGEEVIDLRDAHADTPSTVVDDPYLVALATGHSTLVHRSVGAPYLEDAQEWPAEVGERPDSLPALFQAVAFVEDDNAAVLARVADSTDGDLVATLDLAVLFSERHRDLAIDRVDELVLMGTPPPDIGQARTDPGSQSLSGRARRTEHLWRAAEHFLEADRVEIVSATAIRWWLRRSSSQWRELGRRGLLQPEPGLLPSGVHRLYHRIAETEHAGAVALYRFAELDDPQLARLADRRRSLSKLFRDRLAELDDRSPLPPTGDWTDAVPAPVVVGTDMDDELLDHPLDAALLDWYRREIADVMAEARARAVPIDATPLDPADLPHG